MTDTAVPPNVTVDDARKFVPDIVSGVVGEPAGRLEGVSVATVGAGLFVPPPPPPPPPPVAAVTVKLTEFEATAPGLTTLTGTIPAIPGRTTLPVTVPELTNVVPTLAPLKTIAAPLIKLDPVTVSVSPVFA